MEEPPESSREKLTHSMPTSHHMDLKRLKDEYKDVLKDVPRKTTLVQHDIPTGDAVPIRLPHYRLAHHFKEILSEEIGSLLDQGSLAKVGGVSEALVAETVPETLTKEKQEKLIVNKSNYNPTKEELVIVNMFTIWKNWILRNMLRKCRTHLM